MKYLKVEEERYIGRSTSIVPTYFREEEYKKQYAVELGNVELFKDIIPVEEVDRGIEIVSFLEKLNTDMFSLDVGDLATTSPTIDIPTNEILQLIHGFKHNIGDRCLLLEEDKLPSFVKENKEIPTELLWYKEEIMDE